MNNNSFLNVKYDKNCKNYYATFYGLDFVTTDGLDGVQTAADKIRELSYRYSNADGTSFPIKVFNPERGYILNDVRINDYGNINLLNNEYKFDKSSFPIFVGSDHGASYHIIKNFFNDEDFEVLQFDAHGDYLDEFDSCLHGSVMRKIKSENNICKIIHCGLRGNLNTGPGLEQSKLDGNIILFKNDELLNNIYKSIDDKKNIYISIDIDIFDPSIAPGTNNIEPNGFLYEQFRIILTKIIQKYNVIGIDIVEYNPSLDFSNITGNLIVNLIMEIISAKYNGENYGKYK